MLIRRGLLFFAGCFLPKPLVVYSLVTRRMLKMLAGPVRVFGAAVAAAAVFRTVLMLMVCGMHLVLEGIVHERFPKEPH